MKTKTIEGWVYLDEDKNFTTMNFHQRIPDNFNEMKNVARATMIIEIPEKKIEITESQLRDCFDTFRKLHDDNERRLVYSFLEYTKEKLFGAS